LYQIGIISESFLNAKLSLDILTRVFVRRETLMKLGNYDNIEE